MEPVVQVEVVVEVVVRNRASYVMMALALMVLVEEVVVAVARVALVDMAGVHRSAYLLPPMEPMAWCKTVR